MKSWSILAAVFMLALGISLAAAAESATTKLFRGKIKKIDGANITVGDTTFATDSKTTVTGGEGEKKAVSDLEVGQLVQVTLSEDGKTATAIVLAHKVSIQVPIGGG